MRNATAAAVRTSRSGDRFVLLTPRERDVLSLVAEGRTNVGIARRLRLSYRTVEAHLASVMTKLGIADSDEDNRRVLAVLAHLRAVGAATQPCSDHG